MLGLFDSGSGGLNTVRYIKQNMPHLDVVYKIDRVNCPYGIKSIEELKDIVENNISELVDRGAKRVLIACCTASTVYEYIDNKYKRIAIPIINAVAAHAMRSTKTRNIGVIATSRTVSSHAFARAMIGYNVTEIAAGELVGLIDGGLNDETVSEENEAVLRDIISSFSGKNIDTLILGCTHFPSLKKTFGRICAPMGIKHIIDSAEAGALTICGKL